MPASAPNLTSLGIGLVGVIISLAGIVLLRPSGGTVARPVRRADVDTDGSASRR